MKQVMVKRVLTCNRIGGSNMYENNNFSGYGTGNENTTGTFSGADLNETRTENSYGYENHSTTQSAAGSTNGYTTYQMGGTTGSNNTEPKKTQKHGGYFGRQW